MGLFQAIILGVVEGFTEFLPVSSTGHLILSAKLLRLPSAEFLKSFEIFIQLGAILAVAVLYFRRIISDFKVLKLVLAAFLPSAVLGLVFYKLIKQNLLGNAQVVTWALFLGGIFLIVFEILHRERQDAISDLAGLSYFKAMLIGGFQALAMVPGVSRAAATIIGGLALGLKRKTVVEFSFLLAVPTMVAAALFDLSKSAFAFSRQEFALLAVGFLVSFL
ncbi:MAG: undecaprenyl-diphosphate phosphatase, partial [Candidatus Omnitrophota bacterium]